MKESRGQVRMLKTALFHMDGNWEAKLGMLLMNVVHALLQSVCGLTKRKLCCISLQCNICVQEHDY